MAPPSHGSTLSVALDGTTPLPDGHVAAIVTYLAMEKPPVPRADPTGRDAFALRALHGHDAALYRALFRSLGERWLWFSRLRLDDAALASLLDDADVAAFALMAGNDPAGLLELDWRDDGACELAFFGLTEAHIGRGAGRWLMNRAIEQAWARPIRRFWVHTCTLDHPDALGFYQRSGFHAYKRGIEIVPDPRLTGLMPQTAAPHVPLIPASPSAD